uniref:Uncharacterized protein n=1 Tax=viral metagenome TaxID=1070528 RepID=A0A6C0F377_9ZZZZ
MTLSKDIHDFQSTVFNYIIFASYFLYAAAALGLSAKAPQYLTSLDSYVKIYVCLFLIIRFNPLRKIQFTDLDRRIAFSAGLYILTTTAITKILVTYLKQIQDIFKKKI